MTEFNVNDRVLVPGVVMGRIPTGDDRVDGVEVEMPSGTHWVLNPTDLRPDTGGRDLTADDMEYVFGSLEQRRSEHERFAEYLNRIARGNAGGTHADNEPQYVHSGGAWIDASGHDPKADSGNCPGCAAVKSARAAAGPRAGDTGCACGFPDAPYVHHRADSGLTCEEYGTEVGDTTPDDEPRTDVFLAKLDRMVNEDRIDDPREVRASLDEAQATIRRFRARVAELEGENERLAEGVKSFVRTVDRLADAGNALADTAIAWNEDNPLRWANVKNRVDAWRSAAGGDTR